MTENPISANERLVMLHMLHGLKTQIEGIGYQIDALVIGLSNPEPENNGECKHPPERRTDTSTMGHTRWVCECGHKHEEPLQREPSG